MTSPDTQRDAWPDLLSMDSEDWQARLNHIVETMREVSRHTEPRDMSREYTSRMRYALRSDRFLSLTRRGVGEGEYIVARDQIGEQVHPKHDPHTERHLLPRHAGGLFAELIYGNEPRLIEDPVAVDGDPAAEYIDGYRLVVSMPVFDGGEALNTIVLMFKDPASFDLNKFPAMVWTTNLFARATHNLVLSKQLGEAYDEVDREMKAISRIQTSLLPRQLPAVDTLDVAAHYAPAARAGGDYYDFFELPDGRLGVLIADVSGHGSPAAVIMAITHTLAHTRPGEVTSPADLLTYVNDHLAERYTSHTGSFVTAFYGIYCPRTRSITYASAGHPPPRLKRCSDGSMFTFDADGGLPLGIFANEEYPTRTLELSPGDQVIFYTDGISEAFNPVGEMFGTERLDGVLANCALSARGLIDEVLASVEAFTDGKPADDDRTILVMRVH